ncbi:27888_t:CDS:2, partial [Gigaspora margarita]
MVLNFYFDFLLSFSSSSSSYITILYRITSKQNLYGNAEQPQKTRLCSREETTPESQVICGRYNKK